MNKERDKFLTEAMGECWHNDFPECQHDSYTKCKKCGAYGPYPIESFVDFSTWEGFEKLLNYLDGELSDYDIAETLFKLSKDGGANKLPDKLANWYYEYLKESKDE